MYLRFNCVSANAHIHELFSCYGLKASLLRIKVIDVLFAEAQHGKSVSVREIPERIEFPGVRLLSVREMFKRLEGVGMVHLNDDKSYSLSQEALEVLQRSTATTLR